MFPTCSALGLVAVNTRCIKSANIGVFALGFVVTARDCAPIPCQARAFRDPGDVFMIYHIYCAVVGECFRDTLGPISSLSPGGVQSGWIPATVASPSLRCWRFPAVRIHVYNEDLFIP